MGCECLYMGGGEVYAALESAPGVPGEYFEISQTSTFESSAEVEEVLFTNYDSLVGGNCEAIERISDITLAMTVHSFCPQTLAAQMGATRTARAAAAVTDEAHVVSQGGRIVLDTLPDTGAALVLKDDAGATIADTEYTRNDSGLVMNAAVTGLIDGEAVTVDYTSAAGTVINAFKTLGNTYRVRFPATNLVGKKGRYSVTARRVRWSVASTTGWKTQQQPSFTMTGKVLADPTIAETDTLSQYFQVEIVE